jgi:hypothetical protein
VTPDELRAALAAALDTVDMTGPHPAVTLREVDALLPVVLAYAAAELRAAADAWGRHDDDVDWYGGDAAAFLRDRAENERG